MTHRPGRRRDQLDTVTFRRVILPLTIRDGGSRLGLHVLADPRRHRDPAVRDPGLPRHPAERRRHERPGLRRVHHFSPSDEPTTTARNTSWVAMTTILS